MTEETIPTYRYLDRFEQAHPDDRKIIEKYMQFFGDSFMDVLADFIDWREKGRKPNSFLQRLLKNWGIREWIGEYNPAVLKKMLGKAGITLNMNDDATISNALAQIVVDGKVVTADKKKAMISIQRQMSDLVIANRGYRDKKQGRLLFKEITDLIQKKR